MNIYFLVEGRRTERKLYPAWLSHLVPELEQIDSPDEVEENNYYLVSAEGYPSILYAHMPNAIEDIKASGKYHYFVVCLDAEEFSVQERKEEIYTSLQKNKVKLEATRLIPIIQNRCIETWLLDNRKVYVRNPQNPRLVQYTQYYDVSLEDSELMGIYPEFNTHAQFHYAYLKAIFSEKHMTYSKRQPGNAGDFSYLKQLQSRINEEPTHLATFRDFIAFCATMRSALKSG